MANSTRGPSDVAVDPHVSRRWPGWVYRSGEEPDYRFSLANERTFLAWVRTALALIVAGVAFDLLGPGDPGLSHRSSAAALIVLGSFCAVLGWLRWAATERAMRLKRPLSGMTFGAILGLALAATAVVLLVAL